MNPEKSPSNKTESEKVDAATFDPSQYSRIEDMPAEMRGYFSPVAIRDGGGFRPNVRFERDKVDAILEGHKTRYIDRALGESLREEEEGGMYPMFDYCSDNGVWFDSVRSAVCFTDKVSEDAFFEDKEAIMGLMPGFWEEGEYNADSIILANIGRIPESFFDDPVFVSRMLRRYINTDITNYIPKERLTDKEYVMSIVNEGSSYIDAVSFRELAKDISPELWRDESFRDLFFYKCASSGYKYLPEDLKKDPVVFLSAVFQRLDTSGTSNSNNIGLYEDAPEEVRLNPDVLRAVSRVGTETICEMIPDEKRGDKEFLMDRVLPHLCEPASALRYLDKELPNDFEFLLKVDSLKPSLNSVGSDVYYGLPYEGGLRERYLEYKRSQNS